MMHMDRFYSISMCKCASIGMSSSLCVHPCAYVHVQCAVYTCEPYGSVRNPESTVQNRVYFVDGVRELELGGHGGIFDCAIGADVRVGGELQDVWVREGEGVADAGPRADSAELDHLALAIAAEDNVHGGGSGSLAITIATSARAARAAIAAAVAAAAGVAVAALGARGIASDSARANGGGHGGG